MYGHPRALRRWQKVHKPVQPVGRPPRFGSRRWMERRQAVLPLYDVEYLDATNPEIPGSSNTRNLCQK